MSASTDGRSALCAACRKSIDPYRRTHNAEGRPVHPSCKKGEPALTASARTRPAGFRVG